MCKKEFLSEEKTNLFFHNYEIYIYKYTCENKYIKQLKFVFKRHGVIYYQINSTKFKQWMPHIDR